MEGIHGLSGPHGPLDPGGHFNESVEMTVRSYLNELRLRGARPEKPLAK